MAVIQALQTAASAVRRNPILVAITAVFSLLQLPSFVAQSVSPLLGSLVSIGLSVLTIFIMPFFFGGIIGMANEAIDGQTSLGTLLREGKTHYVSLFVVYLGLLALNLVLGFVGFFAVVLGGVLFLGSIQPNLLLLVIIGIVGLITLVAYLVVLFVTQFFGHAIVVDDLQAVNGLKRSAWCVRHNLLSVFGYTITVTIVGALFGLFGGAFSLLTSPSMPSASATGVSTAPPATPLPVDIPSVGPAGMVGLAILYVIITGLFGGFFSAYSTAFYRSIRPIKAE